MAKQKSVLWTGDRNTSNTINLHLSLQGWSRKLKKKSHKFWKLLIIKGTGNTFKTSGAGTRIYPSADVAVAMFSYVLPPPYNHIHIPSCKQLYVSLRLWLFFRKSLNPGKIPFLWYPPGQRGFVICVTIFCCQACRRVHWDQRLTLLVYSDV